MCCTNPSTIDCNTLAVPRGVAFPSQCGCGCIGKEETASSLRRYREHLQAELNHLDERLSRLDGDSQ